MTILAILFVVFCSSTIFNKTSKRVIGSTLNKLANSATNKTRHITMLIRQILIFTLVAFYSTSTLTLYADKVDRYIQKAKKHEAKGNYKSAAKYYGKVYENLRTPQAKARVLAQKANCQYLNDSIDDSLKSYMKLIDNYPAEIDYSKALDQLRIIAENFINGDNTFLHFKNATQGIDIYKYIILKSPFGNKASADRFRLAQLLENTQRDDEAIQIYRSYLNKFPTANENAIVRISLCNLLMKQAHSGLDGDNQIARELQRILNNFLTKNPKHQLANQANDILTECREHLAAKLLFLGKFYMSDSHKRLRATKRYLNDLIREYPETYSAEFANLYLKDLNQIHLGTTASGKYVKVNKPKVPNKFHPISKGIVLPPAQKLEDIQKENSVQKWLRPLENFDIKKGEK